jgi:hypothetical protein
MDPGERRQQSFFEHLSDSEKRLGARRHSVLDALVIGAIAVIIVGGLTLGVVRLRTLTRIDRIDTAAPLSPPVSASPASPTGSDDKAVPHPAPSRIQSGNDRRPASTPAVSQPGKDERPYIDASKPGKYTIRDSKVEVEINTLSEKERDAKLEQLKKEGLLTEKEAEELKKQQRLP